MQKLSLHRGIGVRREGERPSGALRVLSSLNQTHFWGARTHQRALRTMLLGGGRWRATVRLGSPVRVVRYGRRGELRLVGGATAAPGVHSLRARLQLCKERFLRATPVVSLHVPWCRQRGVGHNIRGLVAAFTVNERVQVQSTLALPQVTEPMNVKAPDPGFPQSPLAHLRRQDPAHLGSAPGAPVQARQEIRRGAEGCARARALSPYTRELKLVEYIGAYPKSHTLSNFRAHGIGHLRRHGSSRHRSMQRRFPGWCVLAADGAVLG